MSFKVVVKGKDKLIKQIQDALSNAVRTTVMRELGSTLRDTIRNRVKSGFGVNSDSVEKPKKQRLDPLSPSYVEYRRKLEATSRLGEFGKPGKSNLTLTGQMLDAIALEARRNGFILSIDKTIREDGRLTNAEVAQWAGQARPFFAITETEQRTLFRQLENNLRAELKKVLGSRSVRT